MGMWGGPSREDACSVCDGNNDCVVCQSGQEKCNARDECPGGCRNCPVGSNALPGSECSQCQVSPAPPSPPSPPPPASNRCTRLRSRPNCGVPIPVLACRTGRSRTAKARPACAARPAQPGRTGRAPPARRRWSRTSTRRTASRVRPASRKRRTRCFAHTAGRGASRWPVKPAAPSAGD